MKLLLIILLPLQSLRSQVFKGFEQNPYFNEKVRTFSFYPNVRIHVNAPTELDRGKPTTLILYALPNGNSIEQTIGRRRADSLDWHYFIQHIGAQVRRLREIEPERNVLIGYLEAAERSWPSWRRAHSNSGRLIEQIADTLRSMFKEYNPKLVLSGHSGGGSFIFGYISEHDSIPPHVERICFLDANYAYSDSEHHGDKLLSWLKADSTHVLSVIAYDDRNITLNGKRVVGPDGGTFRATGRMINCLSRNLQFSLRQDSGILQYSAMRGQIEMLIHLNPDTLILHTILVEKNGFLHGMTVGTSHEKDAGIFFGPAEYEKWIEP